MCNEKTVDMISEDEYLVKMRRRMVDQRLKKVSVEEVLFVVRSGLEDRSKAMSA